MTTSITYHGDHFDYGFRVVDNGIWIASVMSYGDGDRVLASQALERIYVNVLDRIAHPHACAGCGDLTAADLCPACSEDRMIDFAPLDVEFAPFGF